MLSSATLQSSIRASDEIFGKKSYSLQGGSGVFYMPEAPSVESWGLDEERPEAGDKTLAHLLSAKVPPSELGEFVTVVSPGIIKRTS